MSNTARLSLPNLLVAQATKEITHNMALQRLDAFVQTAVESMTLTVPPAGVEGNLYVVVDGATGDWGGKDKNIAQFVGGAWTYYAPFEGLRLWDKERALAMVYKAAAWQQEIAAQGKVAFFGAALAAKNTVTFVNVDNAIGGLTVSAAYSQAEMQVLRNKCEELADDVRALKAALSSYGLV